MIARAKKPVIFISSTVYGIEELLDRIYTLLTAFGYEVWMSHKGTVPVRSDRTAFENCLAGVDACDLFLGIITPSYGSGKDAAGLSITHQELQRAIDLPKPRWLLAHNDVVFARRLLRDLGKDTKEKRHKLKLKKGATSITDLRVIDMYEEAIRHYEPLLERNGNWVQPYSADEDALRFAVSQFSRFQEVEEFLKENLADPAGILASIDRKRGGKP
jgi:hypothetical protein